MMRREMGMIFQSAALFDSLNVLENVMFPLDMFSTHELQGTCQDEHRNVSTAST